MRSIFINRTIGMTSFSTGTNPTIGTNGQSIWQMVSVCSFKHCWPPKLCSQDLRSINWILIISSQTPVRRVYQLLFRCSQTILMKDCNKILYLRRASVGTSWNSIDNRYNLCGVYWVIPCILLVPLCFLRSKTLKWGTHWDLAVDDIVWPQCMMERL